VIVEIPNLFDADLAAAVLRAARQTPAGGTDLVVRALAESGEFGLAVLPRRMGTLSLLMHEPGAPVVLTLAAAALELDLRADVVVVVALEGIGPYAGRLLLDEGDGLRPINISDGQALVAPALARLELRSGTDRTAIAGTLPVQSYIRDDAKREIVHDVESVAAYHGLVGNPTAATLRSVRERLVRLWAEA
jgi:hypothetical protein